LPHEDRRSSVVGRPRAALVRAAPPPGRGCPRARRERRSALRSGVRWCCDREGGWSPAGHQRRVTLKTRVQNLAPRHHTKYPSSMIAARPPTYISTPRTRPRSRYPAAANSRAAMIPT